jgi:hypothetical protein
VIETRQPTVEEAADIIRRSLTDQYKVQCFKAWLVDLGEAFVKRVEQRLTSGKKGDSSGTR